MKIRNAEKEQAVILDINTLEISNTITLKLIYTCDVTGTDVIVQSKDKPAE